MNPLRWMVLFAVLFSAGFANALVMTSEVKPGSSAGSLNFDVHSERRDTGEIRFTIKISEKVGDFPKHYGTSLGTFKVTYDPQLPERIQSMATTTTRPLPSGLKDGVLTCVFSVTEKELEDPDCCFLFGIPTDPPFAGGSNYALRLKDYLKL